jgi:hypothetical protein
MDEFVSCCGYCGDPIDYCQGHGEDERAEFGFDYDSDEYERRREMFEATCGDNMVLNASLELVNVHTGARQDALPSD